MSDTTKLLICPACGAPLDPQPNETTVKCHYCGNSTLLPQSLRSPLSHGDFATSSTGFDLNRAVGQAARMKEVVELVRQGNKIEAIKMFREFSGMGLEESKDAVEAIAAGQPFALDMGTGAAFGSQVISQPAIKVNVRGSRLGLWLGCGITAIVLAGVAAAFIPLLATIPIFAIGAQGLPPAIASALPPEMAAPLGSSVAKQTLAFGGKGSGPGLFDDPRCVASDGAGNIYVGDYQDGRVQVFDRQGQFQRQISIGETILRGMAASPDGTLFLAYDGKVNRYDPSGQPQGALAYDGHIDGITLGADGNLYAVSGGETLVRFAPDGSLALEIPDAISSVSGDPELDTKIAVDGLGNLYALGTFNSAIFKYDPGGNFLDRFGGETETPAQGVDPGHFQAVDAIAVDGYGRVFVSDIWGVQVFDSSGQYLDFFEVEGVAFGMTFDLENNLLIASNTPKVIKYQIQAP
ncbi:MAG: hypothetical protein ACOYYU_21055 [Chloroflexota bacterium]